MFIIICGVIMVFSFFQVIFLERIGSILNNYNPGKYIKPGEYDAFPWAKKIFFINIFILIIEFILIDIHDLFLWVFIIHVFLDFLSVFIFYCMGIAMSEKLKKWKISRAKQKREQEDKLNIIRDKWYHAIDYDELSIEENEIIRQAYRKGFSIVFDRFTYGNQHINKTLKEAKSYLEKLSKS